LVISGLSAQLAARGAAPPSVIRHLNDHIRLLTGATRPRPGGALVSYIRKTRPVPDTIFVMHEGELGRLIGGRYRIDRILGQGGMGYVWLGRDELLDREVAVKEVAFPHLDASNGSRAQREARAAARLNHPGIVTIHDLVTADGRLWIVMELVQAPSLADVLERDGPLPADRVARIGLEVLDALSAAHRAGILHRDIKPGNLLVTSRGAVITDFGIAAIEGEESLTRTGLVVGTLAYMAPELTEPDDDRRQLASKASDLWSLGATLHAAVTGQPPRPGASTGAGLTAGTGVLAAVLEGLLRADPGARLTAEQAAELLRPVAAPAGPARPAPDAAGARAATDRGAETILRPVPPVPLAAAGARGAATRGPDEQTVTRLAPATAPRTSGPVTQVATTPDAAPAPAAGAGRIRLAVALLAIAIAFGIASLFPDYTGFGSLASATDSLVEYAGFVAAWAVSLVLILTRRTAQPTGALLGLGAAAATLGVFLIDLSIAVTGSQARIGPGLVLALLSWASGTAGVVVAIGRRPAGWPARPSGRRLAPAAVLVIAAIGTAAAYGPLSFSYTWDGGSLISGDLYPVSQSLTTDANLFLMVIFVAAVVAAVLWVPARLGAALAAGALIPMALQAAWALVAIAEYVPSSADGGVTPAFQAYCAFIIAGAIACGWLATTREAPRPAIAGHQLQQR
jgi:tRNA A-37 threonylcarbamoyl transferase component Bud32